MSVAKLDGQGARGRGGQGSGGGCRVNVGNLNGMNKTSGRNDIQKAPRGEEARSQGK